MRFPDHEAAVSWYNSPEYQQLIDVRSAAMDARFSLLDGLPTRTEERVHPNERTSQIDHPATLAGVDRCWALQGDVLATYEVVELGGTAVQPVDHVVLVHPQMYVETRT